MSASAVNVHNAVPTPSTPPPILSEPIQNDAPTNEKAAYNSPPALSSSMTPPPSAQPARYFSPDPPPNPKVTDSTIISPLNTLKISATHGLPTSEKIATSAIEDLRVIAQDLANALAEARMSAAHFKLQYTLLVMETQEAAQRAEIEQQMTRREVEVLHAAEQKYRAAASTPRMSLQSLPQPQLSALTRTCKDLEEERDEIGDRLQEIKKLLETEKDRAELLAEENILLKKRIRENREHFTKLKDSPMYATPRQNFTTPRRKSYSRFADDTPAHEPFAALLYADQMLSQETASVPSTPTPTKSHTARFKQGHVRGSHSLSSLHTTPLRRHLPSDNFLDSMIMASAPGSQLVSDSAVRNRHDRDSTISISDAEDVSGDDVPQSQASSLAADMLRKNPASQESIRQSQEVERSSNLLQTKLFGTIKKPSAGRIKGKRSAGQTHEDQAKGKRARLDHTIGLGVGVDQ